MIKFFRSKSFESSTLLATCVALGRTQYSSEAEESAQFKILHDNKRSATED